jgi:hypothetical protein
MYLSNFTVVATGLENPRGLTFGPDGQLYVAEGGRSTNALSTTASQCQQVPVAGPYTGGYNARISRIDPRTGVRTTVVDKLPSSQTSPNLGNLVSGVSDVKFLGDTLYGMEAGAGCSHGLAPTGNPVTSDNTIFRVNPDGSVTLVADLSAFVKANPVANPEPPTPPGDFEPDGTWYGMVAVRGALYATEPNHQEVDQVTPDGRISRVIDMSVQFPGNTNPSAWVGPTGIAYHGTFYVGTLGQFPVVPGTERIYQITPGGQLQVAASGLTAVLGVAFDHEGRMYALETDTVRGFPGQAAAGSGMVVRVNEDGSLTTIASGLTFPTAMTFGPDGALYVSNVGFGVPDNPPLFPDPGQVVRIDVSDGGPGGLADAPLARAATAAGPSDSVQGPFAATATAGPGGAAPVHRGTPGRLAGNFPATYAFTMLTPRPAGGPTTLEPIGTSLFTARNGTELFGRDSGIRHVGADGGATFTTTVSVVHSARKHRRAAGSIVATGALDFATGAVAGTYAGDIARGDGEAPVG